MDKESMNSWIAGIPEAFYDAMAYIVPALYLVLVVLFNVFGFQYLWWLFIKGSALSGFWIRDLFLAFIVFTGLYLIGQLMTTISHYTIFWPLNWVSKKKFDRKRDLNETIIKVKNTHVYLLLLKRYARLIAARNMILGNLLLLIMSCITRHWLSAVFFISVLVPFLIDYISRKKFFCDFIEEILSIHNEYQAKDQHSVA